MGKPEHLARKSLGTQSGGEMLYLRRGTLRDRVPGASGEMPNIHAEAKEAIEARTRSHTGHVPIRESQRDVWRSRARRRGADRGDGTVVERAHLVQNGFQGHRQTTVSDAHLKVARPEILRRRGRHEYRRRHGHREQRRDCRPQRPLSRHRFSLGGLFR
jgi:hypothetical protein